MPLEVLSLPSLLSSTRSSTPTQRPSRCHLSTSNLSKECATASLFCPNTAATPDGSQVWIRLKDTGKTEVFDARPPFSVLKTLDTGPITNHVNFVRNANGMFAYVTLGGVNEVQVFRANGFTKVATIPVGKLPHGIGPSADGLRVYVGLKNDDRLAAIDTITDKVIAVATIGQAPQALAYVSKAVPDGTGTEGLQPLGVAGRAAHFAMVAVRVKAAMDAEAPISVTLFGQGLLQLLEAAVTGFESGQQYDLAVANHADGAEPLEPLSSFMTNPAGSAIVNAIGDIRQVVRGEEDTPRRYLGIVPGSTTQLAKAVQVQAK